jgi:hypothetical protein
MHNFKDCVSSVYSRRGDGGDSPIFLRIPPYFFRGRGKFYIEKEGKKSTNVINSRFFDINPPCFFLILEETLCK